MVEFNDLFDNDPDIFQKKAKVSTSKAHSLAHNIANVLTVV